MKNYTHIFIKTLIGVIFVFILGMFVIEIIDRREFHDQILKNAAIEVEMLKNGHSSVKIDSCVCAADSSKTDSQNNNLSVLDIMKESDGLLGANGLTYIVTLIVALLASLLLFREGEVNNLKDEAKEFRKNAIESKREANKLKIEAEGIEKKYENITNTHFRRISKYDNVLRNVEGIYYLSVIIGYLIIALDYPILYDREKKKNKIWAFIVPKKKGNFENERQIEHICHLCNRLGLLCGQINDCINVQEPKLEFINNDEKTILNIYLSDSCNELKRDLSFAQPINSKELNDSIEDKIEKVKEVINMIDNIKCII